MRVTYFVLSILIQFVLAPAAIADFSIESAIDSIRAVQKNYILCEGECPTYLGLMTLYFEKPSAEQDIQRFEQCLSTLIAPDELITNEHCIPPLTTQKYIRVIFPKSGPYPAESVKLKAVIYKSDALKNPLLDYAILKLERPLTRPTVRLDPKKLTSGDELSVFAHSTQRDDKTGENYMKLTMKGCKVSESTDIGGTTDVTIRLRECLTSEGDSGGPILVPNGGLTGIVWGGGESDTRGVNIRCVRSAMNHISNSNCTQSVEDAAFRLVQSVSFQEIFEIQKFGSRAPVSEDVTGGRLFVSALSCFSRLPNKPIQIKETAVFVDQGSLTQKSLPLESPHVFVSLPISLVLQTEDDHMLVQVFSQDPTPLFSYRANRCRPKL